MKTTEYYNFDLYEMTDNANLCDGYNHAMEHLDVVLQQMASTQVTINNNIAVLLSKVASLETRMDNVEKAV